MGPVHWPGKMAAHALFKKKYIYIKPIHFFFLSHKNRYTYITSWASKKMFCLYDRNPTGSRQYFIKGAILLAFWSFLCFVLSQTPPRRFIDSTSNLASVYKTPPRLKVIKRLFSSRGLGVPWISCSKRKLSLREFVSPFGHFQQLGEDLHPTLIYYYYHYHNLCVWG